ncbi:MAG: AAA family ATPase, partial [Candidatus Omnitrophota bacterium]
MIAGKKTYGRYAEPLKDSSKLSEAVGRITMETLRQRASSPLKPYSYINKQVPKLVENAGGWWEEGEELEEVEFLVIGDREIRCGIPGPRTPIFEELADDLIRVTFLSPEYPDMAKPEEIVLDLRFMQQMQDMITVLTNDDLSATNLALVGSAGAGKDTLVLALVALAKLELRRIDVFPEASDDELLKRRIIDGTLSTVDLKSELLEAAQLGQICVINELLKVKDENVFVCLYSILQEREFENLHAHPFFRCLFLTNQPPEFEEGGQGGTYGTVNAKADFWSRVTLLNIEMPPAEQLAQRLQRVAPDLQTKLQGFEYAGNIFLSLVNLATDLQEKFRQGKLKYEFGFRGLKRIVAHLSVWPEDIAYFLDVFLKNYNVNYHNPEQLDAEKMVIKSQLGFEPLSVLDDPDFDVTDEDIENIIARFKIKGRPALLRKRADKLISIRRFRIYLLWLLKSIILGENIFIFGPTKARKSLITKHLIINRLGFEPEIQRVTSQTDAYSVTQETALDKLKSASQDMPLVVSVKRSAQADKDELCFMFLDEVDKARNINYLSVLNPLLGSGYLILWDRKTIIAGKGWRFIAAGNYPSTTHTEYGGSAVPGDFFDRVVIFEFKHLSVEEENEWLFKAYPKIEKVMQDLGVADLSERLVRAIAIFREGNQTRGIPSLAPATTLERTVRDLIRLPQDADEIIGIFLRHYAGLTTADKKEVLKVLLSNDKNNPIALDRIFLPAAMELKVLKKECPFADGQFIQNLIALAAEWRQAYLGGELSVRVTHKTLAEFLRRCETGREDGVALPEIVDRMFPGLKPKEQEILKKNLGKLLILKVASGDAKVDRAVAHFLAAKEQFIQEGTLAALRSYLKTYVEQRAQFGNLREVVQGLMILDYHPKVKKYLSDILSCVSSPLLKPLPDSTASELVYPRKVFSAAEQKIFLKALEWLKQVLPGILPKETIFASWADEEDIAGLSRLQVLEDTG